MLPADLFLMFRYLKPKRNMISVISLLTLLGPIFGVAIMIVVISIMTGFHTEMKKNILNLHAHFEIWPRYIGQNGISDPESIIERLKAQGIKASPICEGPILIQNKKSATPALIRGILPEYEFEITKIQLLESQTDQLQPGEVYIGRGLAMNLGVKVGDKLLLHSPEKLSRNFEINEEDGTMIVKDQKEAYLPEEVTIVGYFSCGLAQIDNEVIIGHLFQAADLFGYDFGTSSYIHGNVADPLNMEKELAIIRSNAARYYVRPWQERNRALFDALVQEKIMMTFVLSFIVFIASFCIGCVMITVVIQKTREIGILKAIGFSPAAIARIFVYQGLFFGITGTIGGIIAGLLIVDNRKAIAAFISKLIGSEVFNSGVYGLYNLPAEVNFNDIGLIALLAVTLCVLGALLPAIYAASMNPATAIQEGN